MTALRTRIEGAVYVEFLLTFMPLFVLTLALIQFGLICSASILVKHAAWRTARAAIVVLSDDGPSADYAGDPVNQIASGDGLDAYRTAADNGRLDQIRTVARIILAPLAPSETGLTGATIAGALTADASSSFIGLTAWSRDAVAVTFPSDSGTYRTRFSGTGSVAAAVTCLFPCAVPMVSSLMCDTWAQIEPEKARRLESNRAGGLPIVAASGGRVVALQAVAVLPNQGI